MSGLTCWGPPNRDMSWANRSPGFANGDRGEVADLPGEHVGVRDSKDPDGLVLRFTPAEWRAFIVRIRNGEIDRLGEQIDCRQPGVGLVRT